jgi:hypothetical protein
MNSMFETKIISAIKAKKFKPFDIPSKESLNIYLSKKIKPYPHSITYLSVAVMFNNPQAVKHLIQLGASVKGLTNGGVSLDTPITFCRFISEETDFENMVEYLMVKGSDINSIGINNKTLLGYVSEDSPFCSSKRIKFLLTKGANPDGTMESRPISNVIYFNRYLTEEEKTNCAKQLIIYGCVYPKGLSFTNLNIFLDQLALFYDKNIKDLEDHELLLKIERAYGFPNDPSKSTGERKDQLILLHENLSSIVSDKTSFKDYINNFRAISRANESKELKIGNTTLLLGDLIDMYSDQNLYVSKKNNFRWTFHMEELPKIISSGKNPYTFESYTEEELQHMVKSLNFFSYYSDPEDVFNEPKNNCVEETFTTLLSYVINSLEPYVVITDIEKIRLSLFLEIPYLFMDGMFAAQILNFNSYDRSYRKNVLEKMSFIMIHILREEDISLPLITQCFNQVINDDLMCDKILEILGTDKSDIDIIHTLYTIPLGFIEGMFDQEKWEEVVKLITENGQELREIWSYLANKIIRA